jgi:uncharacterized membrane protein
MKELMSYLPHLMAGLFLGSVCVIVYLVLFKTFKKTVLFNGRTAPVVAGAIAVLCVVGLAEFFVIPVEAGGGTEGESHVDATLRYILLPYVALALAILLSQVVVFAGRFMPTGQDSTGSEAAERLATEARRRRRPKKQQPDQKTEAGQAGGKAEAKGNMRSETVRKSHGPS